MQAQSKANEQIITEIKDLRDKTFNLPCKVHEQRINDMGRVIVGLWVIVGAVGSNVVLGYCTNTYSSGKCTCN
jgi:hypothetical protein